MGAALPYDPDLANRIREELADVQGVTERRMFGGLGFLIAGNLAVSASGQGGLLVRVGPGSSDEALARPHTSLMETRGRALPGWVRVAPAGIRTKRELAPWVRRGVDFAGTLPAKRAGRARRAS